MFSNVLLTDESTVKLIDMRGALGDVLTTQGDVTYDLSKVYQSLCGYDHIILDLPRTERAEHRRAGHGRAIPSAELPCCAPAS